MIMHIYHNDDSKDLPNSSTYAEFENILIENQHAEVQLRKIVVMG